MTTSVELLKDLQTIIDPPWENRLSRTIPETEEITAASSAIEVDATILCANLADSSKMARHFDRRVAAKIIKSFIQCSSKLIIARGGKVISVDSDSVVGAFWGDAKNSSAAKCALQIRWVVDQIREKSESGLENVRKASFKIRHGVGIDTGPVLVARGGVRAANDLIWVGRVPNLAVKLSALREHPYSTFISAAVFNSLNEESKYGSDRQPIWERRTWTFLEEPVHMFRSSWYWKP